MKLAVKKEEGSVPMGGFHYMLMPVKMETEVDENIWQLMGHIIIEVRDDVGERLLKECGNALRHQVEIAHLAEEALEKIWPASNLSRVVGAHPSLGAPYGKAERDNETQD